MEIRLTAEEVRVLGCLLEKKMATPEYYPLSLNALVNACNQKVNRDPVVNYNEKVVLDALEGLRSKKLITINVSGRVDKYAEAIVERCELAIDQAAALCILLLRGPQTIGEIRGRTDRLYGFEDLDAVNHTLDTLALLGLVEQAERQPGQKETRFHHLLGGVDNMAKSEVLATPVSSPEPHDSRMVELETRVTRLEAELTLFQNAFAEFKKQFD